MNEITVQVTDDLIMTYPDATEAWRRWSVIPGHGVLVGAWSFMRTAETTFRVVGSVSALEGWVYLDDQPVAYLVRVERTDRGRLGRYTVIGAARYGELSDDEPRREWEDG